MQVGDTVETKYPMEIRDQILGMGHRGKVVRHYANNVWFIRFQGHDEAVTVTEDEVRLIK
jgi:tRNA/tmRNA/rRNA uracil-C5-methylase (TrmA/RlmC/RlmD family)